MNSSGTLPDHQENGEAQVFLDMYDQLCISVICLDICRYVYIYYDHL